MSSILVRVFSFKILKRQNIIIIKSLSKQVENVITIGNYIVFGFMNILQNNNKEELVKQAKKHIEQIRKGEFLVFAKKIITIFGIILTIPIFFISFFILVVVRISSPFFLIRWDWLDSPRIGQFAKWSELYFCNIDAGLNKPKKRYLDLLLIQ